VHNNFTWHTINSYETSCSTVCATLGCNCHTATLLLVNATSLIVPDAEKCSQLSMLRTSRDAVVAGACIFLCSAITSACVSVNVLFLSKCRRKTVNNCMDFFDRVHVCTRLKCEVVVLQRHNVRGILRFSQSFYEVFLMRFVVTRTPRSAIHRMQ